MGLNKNVVISWKLRQTRLGTISIFRLQMLDKIFSFPLTTKLIDFFRKTYFNLTPKTAGYGFCA